MPKELRAKERAKENEECIIPGGLVVMFRIARNFGIAPLRLSKDNGTWRASFSRARNIYGYCFTILLNMCVYAVLSRDPMSFSSIRRLLFLIHIYVGLLIIVLSAFRAKKIMNTLIPCFNNVKKIHDQLFSRSFWSKSTEKQMTVFYLIWILLSGIHTCIEDWVQSQRLDVVYEDSESHLVWVHLYQLSKYLCLSIIQLQTFLFSIITVQLLYAFRTINDNLRNLLEERPSNRRKLKHHSIRALRSMYCSACDSVRDITRSYGPILLLFLASIMFHLVISPFYIIKSMYDGDKAFVEPVHIAYVVLQLLYTINHVVNLAMIVEPCHNTHTEMVVTRQLVSDLMVRTGFVSDPVAVEIDLFYRQLLADQASYSPLDVTDLNRALIVLIFGSVTTYLVILLQI